MDKLAGEQDRARELIAEIVKDAVNIAVLRGDLVKADDEEMDVDELVEDTTRVLCGDECGCLDPDDPDDLAKINRIPNLVADFAASETQALQEQVKMLTEALDSIISICAPNSKRGHHPRLTKVFGRMFDIYSAAKHPEETAAALENSNG